MRETGRNAEPPVLMSLPGFLHGSGLPSAPVGSVTTNMMKASRETHRGSFIFILARFTAVSALLVSFLYKQKGGGGRTA